jgi:hypothetical protein
LIATLAFPEFDIFTSWRLLRPLGHAYEFWQYHEHHAPICRIAVWSEHRSDPSILQRHSTSTFSLLHGEYQSPKLHKYGKETTVSLFHSRKEGFCQQHPQEEP